VILPFVPVFVRFFSVGDLWHDSMLSSYLLVERLHAVKRRQEKELKRTFVLLKREINKDSVIELDDAFHLLETDEKLE